MKGNKEEERGEAALKYQKPKNQCLSYERIINGCIAKVWYINIKLAIVAGMRTARDT